MGAAKRSRDAFFAANLRCAFCAGEAAAEEQDHQPARIFFRDRAWPEGFVFPSCRACNVQSSDSENIVSAIAVDLTSDQGKENYSRRIEYLRQEHPELFRRLEMSANEKRRFLNENRLTKPSKLPFAEMPLIRLSSDVWNPHVKLVGQKIMLGLHYQCFKKPLSRQGGLWIYWQTNATAAKIVNDELFNIAENVVEPVRNNTLLDNQFAVRWAVGQKPETGLFIIHLQKTIFIAGITAEEPDRLGARLAAEMLRPLGRT